MAWSVSRRFSARPDDRSDARIAGIWGAAVDQRPDPRHVLGIAAPVSKLSRAQPRECGFDGGGGQPDAEVRWDWSPRVAHAEEPIEHEAPHDVLEVRRVPIESHLGATSRLGKSLGRDGRVSAEVPQRDRRRTGVSRCVFGQQLDKRALGILESHPFPDGRRDLQLVRVLGRDEDAQVHALRATECDDVPDIVHGCLAGGRGWLGSATWTLSVRCELPLPLESNLESIYLFEISARAEPLEVLAGPAEEHLPEALPVRREPLWLAITLRSDRRQAGAQRVEAGEHLEVSPYERWQGPAAGRVQQVRIEVWTSSGRSQGGVVRIEAEHDLPERPHGVGMKEVLVHLLRGRPVEGEVVYGLRGWVPPLM